MSLSRVCFFCGRWACSLLFWVHTSRLGDVISTKTPNSMSVADPGSFAPTFGTLRPTTEFFDKAQNMRVFFSEVSLLRIDSQQESATRRACLTKEMKSGQEDRTSIQFK